MRCHVFVANAQIRKMIQRGDRNLIAVWDVTFSQWLSCYANVVGQAVQQRSATSQNTQYSEPYAVKNKAYCTNYTVFSCMAFQRIYTFKASAVRTVHNWTAHCEKGAQVAGTNINP